MSDKFLSGLRKLIAREGEVAVAAMVGVSQATVNRWRNKMTKPRGLSARAVEAVLKQEGLL